MKFTEHLNPDVNLIRQYAPNRIQVNQHTLTESCIICQHDLITQWPVKHVTELNESNMLALVKLQPEVLILGTGETQRFPATQIMQFFIQHGISLEVMSNDAACRTYNILTTEDRIVVAAFIMANA